MKRVTASFVAVSVGLALAGCEYGNGPETYLAIVTAPAWVPAALVYCATSGGCKDPSSSTTQAWLAKWRARAESGDPDAQLALGNMYFYGGGGLKQDDAEAAKWYRRSAESGNAVAQCALASMYEWGRGVDADEVQADVWYSVAIAKLAAYDRAGHAVQNRDALEKRMTAEQIAEARKCAEQWKPVSRDSQSISRAGRINARESVP